MVILLAVTSGVLYAAGIYLLLQRRLAQVIIGLGFMTNAANLLIFTAAGLRRNRPPIIPPDGLTLEPGSSDPLAQALILTAIVIGFGILAFALALAYRAYRTIGSDDIDQMRAGNP